jgi:hypothetical protein
MSIYKRYIDFIRDTQLQLQPKNWNFKKCSDYTYMLEHVNFDQGKQYLSVIKNKFNVFYKNNSEFLKDLCNLNDKYGKTNKYQFEDFMTCSPTNLRYILHSLLILEDMKKYKLNKIDIIEIGGGYGGLCFFIHNIAPLYGISINSYTIFDLLEASLLQEKYLNALNIKNNYFCQLDNFHNLKNNSFLISTYAFSEIPISIQKEYSEKIINQRTKFGFVAWNNIPVYNFVENSIIEKEKEHPLTKVQNYYVRYYPIPPFITP